MPPVLVSHFIPLFVSPFPSGHYLYVEGGFLGVGETASILSPVYSALHGSFSNLCRLEFFYHAQGNDVGTLTVNIHINNTQQTLWRVTGDQGNQWRRATPTLPQITGKTFQVRKATLEYFSI